MKELWHSRVKITQLPIKVEEEKILLGDIGVKEIPKTWMYDILSDQSI